MGMSYGVLSLRLQLFEYYTMPLQGSIGMDLVCVCP